MKPAYGIIAGLITAIAWGTIGIWIKNIPLSAVNIVIFRLVGSGIFFSFLTFPLLRKNASLVFTVNKLIKAIFCGIIIFLQFFATIIAYQSLTNGMATILTNLHLLFLIIFSLPTLYKNKKMLLGSFVGFIFVLFGIYIIFGGQQGMLIKSGLFMGIAASCLFALYSKLIEKFFPETPQQYLGLIFLTGALISTIFAITTKISIPHLTAYSYTFLAILIGFPTIIAHFSYVLSVKWIGSFGAVILSYFAIIFGVIVDSLILKKFIFMQIIGTLIIFVTLCLLTIMNTRKSNIIKTSTIDS